MEAFKPTSYTDNALKGATKTADELAAEAANEGTDLATNLGKNTNINIDTHDVYIPERGGTNIPTNQGNNIPTNLGKTTETDLTKNITKEGQETLEKDNSIIGIMKRNPGTTAIGAVILTLGITGVAMAEESYNKNNDKKLTIIKMESPNSKSPSNFSSSESPNNFSSSESPKPSSILITFDPKTDFVKNDKIEIGDTNMVPGHKGDVFDVIEIVSKTSIKVNIPDITTYGTSGTIILKTSRENRLLQAIHDGENQTTNFLNGGLDTIKNFLGDSLSKISDILGPWMVYVEIICGIIFCLCCLMCVLYMINNRPHKRNN